MRSDLYKAARDIEVIAHDLKQMELSKAITGTGWSPDDRRRLVAGHLRTAIELLQELDNAMTAEENGARWMQLDQHLTEEETQMILAHRRDGK